MTSRKDDPPVAKDDDDDNDDDNTETAATPKAPLSATAKQEAKAMQALSAGDHAFAADETKFNKDKVKLALIELAKKNAETRQHRLTELAELAKVVVSPDDVALIARELLLSPADAELTLKKHGGSAEAALRAFISA